MLLKGNFAKKSWPIDAVVGAVWMGHGSDFPWRRLGFWIGIEWATISLQRSHDRAAIGPRLCVDRDLDSQTNAVWFNWNDRGIDSMMKEPWSRLDRTAIAVRLRHDRGFLPRVFPIVRWGSDAPCVSVKRRKSGLTWLSDQDCAALMLMKISSPRVATCPRWAESQPSDGVPWRSLDLMNKSGPSSKLRVRCRSDALEPSTCRQVSRWSPHLLLIFKHVSWLTITWTQVHAIDGLRSSPTALIQTRVLQR